MRAARVVTGAGGRDPGRRRRRRGLPHHGGGAGGRGGAGRRAPGRVETYADATLMPGLVDAHAHLTLAADRRTYEQMVLDPDEMMALVSVSNLQRHLACGVTTLRDNGGRNRVTFIVREAIKRGYFIGPAAAAQRPADHPPLRPLLLVQRGGRRRRGDPGDRPAAGGRGRRPHQDHGLGRRHRRQHPVLRLLRRRGAAGRGRDRARARPADHRALPGQAVDGQRRSRRGWTASSTPSS